MGNWTMSIAGADPVSLASLKIQGGTIEYISRGLDQATLSASASVTWAYGTTVGIYYKGLRVFYGRVLSNRLMRDGSGGSDRSIVVAGVQYWLERCPYRQAWAAWVGDALGSVPSSRVVLNAAGPISHITADGEVHAIVDYAASRGAPIAFGSSALAITLPFDEQRDITCRQALERELRMTPSVCDWVDYSQAVPAIHFGQSSAFVPARVERDEIDYRYDLVVPGVRVEIERINSAGGEQYRSLELLVAGDQASVDTVFVSLALAGSEFSVDLRTLDVETEEIGDISSASWWKSKHPRLADVAAEDITVVSFERGLTPEEYPRISSCALPDLTEADCKARLETFKAVVDVVQRATDGEELEKHTKLKLEMQFVTTDAETKTYKWHDKLEVTSAEETPAGLAAALLAHWSVLYASGSFSCPLAEGLPHPGQLIEDSPIQSVRVDMESETVTGVFGPPSQLSAQDFVSLLQGFRTTRKSLRVGSRYTGEPAKTDEDKQDLFAPVSSSDWSPGETKKMVIRNTAGTAKISLDPSDLDEDETVSPRLCTFKDANDKTTKEIKVMASEDVSIDAVPDGDSTNVALMWNNGSTPGSWGKALPVHGTNDALSAELEEGDRVVTGVKTGPPGSLLQLETRPLPALGGGLADTDLTEITLVTSVQISGTYLQVKTRTAKVYAPGTESAWTTVHTFPGFAD